MATVIAPVNGFSGDVAGVSFTDGRAETTDPRALAYFRRAGYRVDSKVVATEAETVVDARDAAEVKLGTPLRDAAVDPRLEDHLAPTNAGKADPHGPDVVSPEIHGTGPAEIVAGDVDPDPAAQDADETAATVDELDVDLEQPAKGDPKAAWVAYAVSQGADPAEAEAATKADLVERYGA